MAELVRHKRRRMRNWRDYLRLAFRGRHSPEQVARGVVIGLIVGLTPLLGLHILLVLLLATLLNASRVASLPPVFITNVFTFVPIYTFTCRLGFSFLPWEPHNVRGTLVRLHEVLSRHDAVNLAGQLRAVLKVSGEMILAMFIGGLLVAAAASAVAYPLTVRAVRRHRQRRADRLRQRRHDATVARAKEKPEAWAPPDSP